jgi:hypothetical protein
MRAPAAMRRHRTTVISSYGDLSLVTSASAPNASWPRTSPGPSRANRQADRPKSTLWHHLGRRSYTSNRFSLPIHIPHWRVIGI